MRRTRLASSSIAAWRLRLDLASALAVKALIGFIVFTGLVPAYAAPPRLSAVEPGRQLVFPQDFGAHPGFRTEWWYATGWVETPDGKPLGFQVTFFRSTTDHDPANPSRFAPKQLIIAHAALSDPAEGKLLHDQKSAREGFGIAHAKEGNTDVRLGAWTFVRSAQGSYEAVVPAGEFELRLRLEPTQPVMLQGEQGYSRKGPRPEQASYYYSEPQLKVSGTIVRHGKPVQVSGSAWLDHEWSTSVLDQNATGWDWVGANLDDGSALMAFQIRNKDGSRLWAHAALRTPDGRVTRFAPEQVSFTPQRTWRSPRTGASYPVAMRITAGGQAFELDPLQDDQELDSRQSTGAVYWEGAVTLTRDGRRIGRGYLEMTGYVKPIKL
ncbi:carotenoid 1,2-hydratase [Noviherbaspirillum sp. CPCC 100848]|uniref:Carotenoid 1,2-hydratase n=1 Tax=Noviherbaspirillum album TaxID=3080276 RepID=A0ABU6JC07_9BURK|nr:carotenoid 1,2-hydratase [Noviherbaspirillum sp. CPCC 100848]MEC4721172.1 carotenoid 1,2-hydratase [Noviherbaspirillum sp. CPCC 100848]